MTLFTLWACRLFHCYTRRLRDKTFQFAAKALSIVRRRCGPEYCLVLHPSLLCESAPLLIERATPSPDLS